MHLSMKGVFLTLSLLSLLSCGDRQKPVEEIKTVTNEMIIDSILLESKNWNDSTEQIIDRLGKQLKQPYRYYSTGNKYDPSSIYITSTDSTYFDHLKKHFSNKRTDVKSFGAYKVYYIKRKSRPDIRYSIRPHPLLNWVLSIERVY
jgi:hypothetical protein